MSDKSKVCTTCGVDKPLSAYNNDKRGRLGKQARCKVCKSAKDKAYRDRKGEELLKKRRAYYAENKERAREWGIEYREKNKEVISERRKVYRQKNKEEIAERKRKYYQKNKEEILEKRKEYYKENREAVIEKNNRYERERRRTDPTFRLLLNTKGAVYKALMRENGGKNGSRTLNALPFTIDELKAHLEAQFDENMTWENYGSYWHVDHIYPLKLLPYDSLEHEHFKLVWDLRNLRPLEGIENNSKSSAIPDVIPEHIKLFLEK